MKCNISFCKHVSIMVAVSVFSLLALSTAKSTADNATATAGSGFFAAATATTPGSATWRFSNPTAADTISWQSGVNNADATAFGPFPFGPEPKFTTVPALAGRVFAGFAHTDTGPNGSKAITSGTGSSALKAGTIWGTNAVATWSVTATGTLGIAFPGPWNYDSVAIGKDPMNIHASDLTSYAGSNYNLFFAGGLSAGSFSPLGDIGLSMSYQTSAGTTSLLNIVLNASGATVTNAGPSNLTFYRLSTLDEGPTEIAANIVTLANIKSLLDADIIGDNTLNTPLYLGVVLDHLAKPTVDMGDGSVAKIHVDAYAHDAASKLAVPEPGSLISIGAGTLCMIGMAYRRRRFSRRTR